MTIYYVKDDSRIVGFLLEGENLSGRVQGGEKKHGARQTLIRILKHMEKGLPVETLRGTSRVVKRLTLKDEDFMQAVIRHCPPPYQIFYAGEAPNSEQPDTVTERLWVILNIDGDLPTHERYA